MPSYIKDYYKVTQPEYEYIGNLTRNCSKKTHRLFSHILACDLQRLAGRDDDLFIPVAWQLIDRQLKGASCRDLQQKGLVEVKPYDRYLGLSREFKVADWVLEEFMKLEGMPATEYQQQFVDLFTGRPSRRIDKNEMNDSNGHPHPQIIRSAMKVFQENHCPYNLTAIEQYLKECKGGLRENSKEYEKELRRYNGNLACRNAVLKRTLGTAAEGINYYRPAYSVTKSGRIHQIGGALQSCSRLMKHHAYIDIPNLYNYDLNASQVNILIQQFEHAGLDTSWLKTYRDTPNNKYEYAKKAGVPVDEFKTCLLCVVMGGHLPRSTKDYASRDNSILKKLANLAGGDEDKLEELRAGFAEVVMPLVEQLEKWHEWLLTEYITREKKYSPAGWFIKNAVGMRLYLSELPKGKDRWLAKSQLAAFLLQGVEASTIHNLTMLGDKYGFTPVSNEHDGLITRGKIPPEAVMEAARLSGFRNARLEIKGYV
jgi:hypothetical protein